MKERILNVRKNLALTQKELAEVLGTVKMTISRWETGRHLPRGEPFEKFLELEASLKDFPEDIVDLQKKCLEKGLLPGPLQSLLPMLSKDMQELILSTILSGREEC